MANFLINSPGLVTTGTDQGETFLVQSAAVSATTILGLAGNDTIDLLEGRASAEKVSIAAGGGAELGQPGGVAAVRLPPEHAAGPAGTALRS